MIHRNGHEYLASNEEFDVTISKGRVNLIRVTKYFENTVFRAIMGCVVINNIQSRLS